jgi:hypothetical protein
MQRTRRSVLTAVALGAAALVLVGAQATKGTEPAKPTEPATRPVPAKAPSIQGTWKLISRDLPDGTKLKHPEIVGLLTFSEKFRNFNVSWQNASGKHFSMSLISEYKLTDKEYSEKNLYRLTNDEINGAGLQYDSGKSGKSPVKWDGSRLEIKLPLFNEPVVVFEGSKFTATRAGEFTDYWEKVN